MLKARDIASKLREIRKTRGHSQEHVARALGLSPSQVSRIESGKRGLSIDQLGPWAASLGVRAELILWETEGGVDSGMSFLAGQLDEESISVLRQVAATLPHMNPHSQAALVHIMRMLRAENEEVQMGSEPARPLYAFSGNQAG